MTDDPATLVSPAWLAARLGDPALVVLDASWHLPGPGGTPERNAEAEFREAHVPGAWRFDLDAVSDQESPLPHMAPSPEVFARAAQAMGVGPGSQVVAYDSLGLFSAARAWWTFRLMGHRAVAVLDGGLPLWLAEGRPVEGGEARGSDAGSIPAALDPTLIASADQVEAALGSGAAQVVDARSRARFRGEAPEPRAGVRSGHMPGALNLPFGEVLGPDGRMKDAPGLRAALAAEGIDPARPVIATCGSGVTAAVLALALARLGREAALYDGSWAEWGADPNRPVATRG